MLSREVTPHCLKSLQESYSEGRLRLFFMLTADPLSPGAVRQIWRHNCWDMPQFRSYFCTLQCLGFQFGFPLFLYRRLCVGIVCVVTPIVQVNTAAATWALTAGLEVVAENVSNRLWSSGCTVAVKVLSCHGLSSNTVCSSLHILRVAWAPARPTEQTHRSVGCKVVCRSAATVCRPKQLNITPYLREVDVRKGWDWDQLIW